jgi:hypothetical protein
LAETVPKTKLVQKDMPWSFLSLWPVPRLWPDSTVYIIGGGPSVSETPLHLIHGKNVIGVNNAYKLGDWVNVCWFGDSRWFKWNMQGLKNFKGLLVTCQRKLKHAEDYDVKSVQKGKPAGIERKPTRVCWNGSSGGSAINLAYHFGAKKIVLIGFDMKPVNGKYNYHSDYPEKRTAINPYAKFMIPFPAVKKEADKLGLEILNATPNSAIKSFKIVKLEDVV